MTACTKCKQPVFRTRKEKDREILVNMLNTEIVLSRLLDKMFNKIGRTVMSLADFNSFISSFRLSKNDSKAVLKELIDTGVIEKRGGGRITEELRLVGVKPIGSEKK